MKKVSGKNADEHYKMVDEETGEIYTIQPEYTTMSRRPGIGKGWYDKYKDDVYPSDFIVQNGKKMRPPKFYDTLLEREHIDSYESIKLSRKQQALMNVADNTADRLYVKEEVKKASIKSLKRNHDDY